MCKCRSRYRSKGKNYFITRPPIVCLKRLQPGKKTPVFRSRFKQPIPIKSKR